MKKLLNFVYFATILLTFAIGVSAQNSTPKPVEKPAVEAPKTVALTLEQNQQLREAQKLIELAETRAAEAKAQLEKLQAQVASLVADFRWQLGLNPKDYQPNLQLIDQQAGTLGFVPLARK